MVHRQKETDSLGGKIKKRREELGLSIEEIAREILTNADYVRAIEDDDYGVFSAKVYARGFFKKILVVLAIDDPAVFVGEFDREWDIQRFRNRPEMTPLPENRGRMPYLTPKRLGIGGLCVFLLFVAVFFGYRFMHFLVPPKLTIIEPWDLSEVNEPVVRLKGETEKESRLTVNGREVTISARGDFDETFELAAGLNILEFIVKDRFGKMSKESRAIFVK